MTLKEILNKFKIETSLKFETKFFNLKIEYNDVDRLAAWDLYVELITRITTQPLDENSGDEQTALDSVFGIFKLTRKILHKNGPRCANFAKVAVIVLNIVIRPFTAKWHKLSINKAFEDEALRKAFRAELKILQENMLAYTDILAETAGLEKNIIRMEGDKNKK